ncbi:MAG: hypothetical protein ACFFEA_10620 [Candidatus Thorarchaeota archaeon]
MSKKLSVAGLQLVKSEDGEANLEKFEKVARKTKASFPWIDRIFTGEFYLQQYGKSDWKDTAGPLPNQLTGRLGELAKKLECWLMTGSFFDKVLLTGNTHNPINLPTRCRFHSRCLFAKANCAEIELELQLQSDERMVACLDE